MFIDILRNKGAYPDARCFAGHDYEWIDHREGRRGIRDGFAP